MQLSEFIELVPAAERSEVTAGTLTLWHQIYVYISQRGSADTVDDDAFVKHLRQHSTISISTIARHLRRMARAGILDGHILQRQADPLINMMRSALMDGLPARFIRYTLPGMNAPLDLDRSKQYTDVAKQILKTIGPETNGKP